MAVTEGVTTDVDPSTTTTADAESSSSSGGTSSGSSGESTTTGEQGCPGEGVCFPPAPPRWDGPAVMLVGQSEGVEPMCPPGSEVLWRAGTDPAARCDCSECGGDIGCDVELGFGSNGTCPEGSTGSGCQPFSTELTGQFYMSLALDVSAGAACDSPQPADPGFREQAVGCRPNAETCEGGVCLLGRACISRPGDFEACPPDYPDRSLLYTSASGSDLSCDTCGCGDDGVGFLCTEATVTLYDGPDCAGASSSPPLLAAASGECDPYDDPKGFVAIEEIASVDIQIPQADCSSDRGFENASGEFDVADPRTVCCSG
ncbi:MAG: hypothetical protein ACRBN8_04880 [Nannocystales bacterium]